MPVVERGPPQRVVWEITRRCLLACAHCLVEAGPRAASASDGRELDPSEALSLVDAIADLGAPRISLTGGEPLLRPDWAAIVARSRERGLEVALSTNGHAITDRVADRIAALGVTEVAVSIDGSPERHDERRAWEAARRSSYAQVEAAIRRCLERGIEVTVLTTLAADNADDVEQVHRAVRTLGVDRWMVQLAHTTGRLQSGMLPRAALPDLLRRLAVLTRDPVLPPIIHHTLGYYSEDEPLLRASGRRRPMLWRFWRGSPCGRSMMGIEPDGGVKGCPNQVGAPFVVGSVRRESLATIWNDRSRWFWLDPDPALLTGACGGCRMGRVCGGGCPCVAQATTGHLFDDPYCVEALREGRA